MKAKTWNEQKNRNESWWKWSEMENEMASHVTEVTQRWNCTSSQTNERHQTESDEMIFQLLNTLAALQWHYIKKKFSQRSENCMCFEALTWKFVGKLLSMTLIWEIGRLRRFACKKPFCDLVLQWRYIDEKTIG